MTDHALLRELPDTFSHALVREGSPKLDVDRAREQHVNYQNHIEHSGYQTNLLPADPGHPDCLFVEDAAVVVGQTALIARSGAESRRGEVGLVAAALESHFDMVTMSAPGTLDGGDVFILNETIYVGRSERTNEDGIHQLGALGSSYGLAVAPISVSGVLHLKSAVLPIDPETVVVTPGTVDESLLKDLRIIHEDNAERHQFSALPLRSGAVLVTKNSPRTTEVVAGLGHEVIPIDVSEIQAADGGLTCMSVLFSTNSP